MEDLLANQVDRPNISNEPSKSINEPQIPQPQIIQTFAQPYNIKTNLPAIIDSQNLEQKLCCLKCWLPFKIVPLFIGIVSCFSLEVIPFVEFPGLIVLIIVCCLVYKINKKQDEKKYNIALNIYTIYFIFACLYYLFLVCGSIIYYCKNNDGDTYRFFPSTYIEKNIDTCFYLIEIGIEITTLYLLCAFKKVFNTVSNDENRFRILPLQA